MVRSTVLVPRDQAMMNIQRKRALRVLGFSLIAGLVVVWAVRSVFNAKHSAAELERVVVLNPSDNGSPPHRWPVHINVPQGPPRCGRSHPTGWAE